MLIPTEESVGLCVMCGPPAQGCPYAAAYSDYVRFEPIGATFCACHRMGTALRFT
jgi:hypothetical protein